MTGLTATLVLHAALLAPSAQPYEDAYRQMNDNGKPLLVLVGADWCPACRQLKGTTANMEKRGTLSGVAFSVVDYDRSPGLAKKIMRGSSIPQLILFEKTPRGWRRTQLNGGQSEGSVASFVGGATQHAAEYTAQSTSDEATEK